MRFFKMDPLLCLLVIQSFVLYEFSPKEIHLKGLRLANIFLLRYQLSRNGRLSLNVLVNLEIKNGNNRWKHQEGIEFHLGRPAFQGCMR